MARITSDFNIAPACLDVLTGTDFLGVACSGFAAGEHVGETWSGSGYIKAKTAGDIGKTVDIILIANPTGEEYGATFTLTNTWQKVEVVGLWAVAGITSLRLDFRAASGVATAFFLDTVDASIPGAQDPPTFVGAGSGVALTTGTGTVSKTGCTAGNLLLVHLVIRGNSEDWSAFSNEVNVEELNGTPGNIQGIVTGLAIGVGGPSRQALFCCRVTADGTCSGDFSVGASGEDMYARIYEFTDASRGLTVADVFEAGSGTYDATDGTGSTLSSWEITTNGLNRLALQFVALASNQVLGSFGGESGGDWVEAVPEYGTSTGTAATLQLQTADMPAAGTISGGSQSISSTDWGEIVTAIRPGFGEILKQARLGTGSGIYR